MVTKIISIVQIARGVHAKMKNMERAPYLCSNGTIKRMVANASPKFSKFGTLFVFGSIPNVEPVSDTLRKLPKRDNPTPTNGCSSIDPSIEQKVPNRQKCEL
jgi:hypothetical protein